jgi:hypothetical protein
MSTADGSTQRREFLAQLATAAVAVAGTACAPAIASQQVAPAPAPMPGAAPAASAAPSSAARPASARRTFDDSWTARVAKAKHKAVFDSPEVVGGIALWQAFSYMRGYKAVFDTPDADVRPVIVMRHMATVMAFGDALWAKYDLGEATKLKDPTTGEPARRNPFLHADRGDKFALMDAQTTLTALHARGATLLACDQAAMGFAGQMAQKHKLDVEAVRAEIRAGLVPGVILQPSGIYATARAQEIGCVFMRAG